MKQNQSEHKRRFHLPQSKVGKILLNLAVTAVVGFLYFYFSLPALNLQSEDFYFFLGLLCVTYTLCAFLTSGFHLEGATVTAPDGTRMTVPGGKLRSYLGFVRKQCLPAGIVLAVLVVVWVVGQLVSIPLFRAADYRQLLPVENGDFASEVSEVSFDEIPRLDESSARYLSTTQMGTIPDMASQFEVAYLSTQINYQGSPVRVFPLEYADLIRWFTNRVGGLSAYIVVDMVTQEVKVVRLPEGQGMKYSLSEPFNRNVSRHLRFSYPTFLFGTPSFEIDESGQPWWICPRIVKTIGLFGGTDVHGAVLVNAVTGESQYYEEVPQWVDRVYPASLLMEQYDYFGTLVHGFFNSIFGQRDVKLTTENFNYIAMNDDVYMYTGVTSATSDQSNLGFLLVNQRTKATRFYTAPGATEQAAQRSAEGAVQDLGYVATFPLLLNVSGEPTYFLALKDYNQLVKQYAMVNVNKYSTAVATAPTVAACEEEYIRLLGEQDIIAPEQRPQTQVSGIIDDLRPAVIDGNTVYFIRLEGSEVYYTLSAAENPQAVILNVGDAVTIEHAPLSEGEEAPILAGYHITRKE